MNMICFVGGILVGIIFTAVFILTFINSEETD